jgi:hypothetical protein
MTRPAVMLYATDWTGAARIEIWEDVEPMRPGEDKMRITIIRLSEGALVDVRPGDGCALYFEHANADTSLRGACAGRALSVGFVCAQPNGRGGIG